MRYYVVADVHGFYTQLISALKEKGYFEDNTPHKLIVCGDLFDRGREAKEMQRFITELMAKDEVILIKGNHEDLALDLLHRSHYYMYDLEAAVCSHHYHNGTIQTLCDLTDRDVEFAVKGVYNFVYDAMHTPYVREIIPAMLDYFETPNYIFVHGWIPCRTDIPGGRAQRFEYIENWRNASEEEWDRSRWLNGMAAWAQGVTEPQKTIVCGHWHTSYGHSVIEHCGGEFDPSADFTPFVKPGIIALDACTAHSGFINCIVIDD